MCTHTMSKSHPIEDRTGVTLHSVAVKRPAEDSNPVNSGQGRGKRVVCCLVRR
jgi:hypothetical protein